MRKLRRGAVLLVSLAGLIAMGASRSGAQVLDRMEFGGGYSFVNSNVPPGGCGCFISNGGMGWAAYNFVPRLAVVGEVGSWYAGDIDHTGASLNLTSFTAGVRYSWHRGRRIAPFGQVLLGGAHASGALTPTASGLPSSANAFAMTAGGGVDVELMRHWTARLVQVDYFLTTFDNSGNDHQNNLRVGVGVAFHPGKGK